MWPEHYNYFCGVTQDWMSYVFDMLFLFWLIVLCLLSSLDKIDVRLELLADDVWEAEDDKTVSWVLEWIVFINHFCKNDQCTLLWWKIVLKIENMINEDKQKFQQIKNMKDQFWWMFKNIFLGATSYEKYQQIKKW